MDKKQPIPLKIIMEKLKDTDYESYQDIEAEVINLGQRIKQQEKASKSTD